MHSPSPQACEAEPGKAASGSWLCGCSPRPLRQAQEAAPHRTPQLGASIFADYGHELAVLVTSQSCELANPTSFARSSAETPHLRVCHVYSFFCQTLHHQDPCRLCEPLNTPPMRAYCSGCILGLQFPAASPGQQRLITRWASRVNCC